MSQAAGDLPDDLPFGVVETCRELLKDWGAEPRGAKCLRRLVADPEMCAIYWRLNENFDDDANRIGLFVRQVFLSAITAGQDQYRADKQARDEFNCRRHRAHNAARELADQIDYLSKVDHGGLSLRISLDALQTAAASARQIAQALADPGKVSDFWCEQSSGTAPAPVFVRALEKHLHKTDTYGLTGLNDGSGARLLSYADMATVARVALGMQHNPESGTRFDAAHVADALKSYRETS